MAYIIANCFSWFFHDNILYILVVWGLSDKSLRKSQKWTKRSPRLNWNIFVKSEISFAIYDKNYHRKKWGSQDDFEIWDFQPSRILCIGNISHLGLFFALFCMSHLMAYNKHASRLKNRLCFKISEKMKVLKYSRKQFWGTFLTLPSPKKQ